MVGKRINIMTCGNVDDGKSTLLGRFLFETNNISIDQSEYLKRIQQHFLSKNLEQEIDYSMLLDGLIDEKKQGITIDIAFKFFKLGSREFVFIDSPGHQEYTKNMAHAATHANAALLIVDITNGFSEQTINHLNIISIFPNVENIIVCINKMDKVNYSKLKFNELVKKIQKYAEEKNIKIQNFIPVSGLMGENITSKSKKMKFYTGNCLYDLILNIPSISNNSPNWSYFKIQNIEKYKQDRIYHAQHYGKRIKINDTLVNQRTNQKVKIKNIYSNFKSVDNVFRKSANLQFKNEIDITQGDILTKNYEIAKSDSFKALIVASNGSGLIKNKRYLFQFDHFSSKGYISKIKKIHNTYIYEFTVELESKSIFCDYKNAYELSKLMIIDISSNETMGFGYVMYKLDRGINVIEQDTVFSNKFTDCKTIWLTGLPASGKSTISNVLGEQLNKNNIKFYILDGDNLRSTINKNLGFSKEDRIENNRRVAYIAKVLNDAGVNAIVATVSPYKENRDLARDIIGQDNFIEVYVKASIETCISRDPKNLYSSSKKIKNITGLHEDYEVPNDPGIVLETEKYTPKELAEDLLKFFV